MAPIPKIDGFTSETEQVGGVRLHYWRGGDPAGPPVLLWHGFLASGYVWRKVMPALAQAGCAVLAPDMRGYGDSDKPAGDIGYDGQALAEEFRALAQQIGFGDGRPLTLVAHDMGAPPALLWAAAHPEDVLGLVYIEVPVMLPEVLTRIIAYTPEAMAKGSMWWWILPLAPGVAERLIVGNERAFLTWFYDRDQETKEATADAVDEYLRTFSGREGVLGALGVYRTAFTTIEQTTPLTHSKVKVPIIALGGTRGANGENVRKMAQLVAEDVGGGAIEGCGHFVPEERPDVIVRHVLELIHTLANSRL
jgi:pimeloyl-ACP methyl ester carboxylesterase